MRSFDWDTNPKFFRQLVRLSMLSVTLSPVFSPSLSAFRCCDSMFSHTASLLEVEPGEMHVIERQKRVPGWLQCWGFCTMSERLAAWSTWWLHTHLVSRRLWSFCDACCVVRNSTSSTRRGGGDDRFDFLSKATADTWFDSTLRSSLYDRKSLTISPSRVFEKLILILDLKWRSEKFSPGWREVSEKLPALEKISI